MTLIKSISGIRGTIGGKVGDNLTPVDAVKFASAYGTFLKEGSGALENGRKLLVVIKFILNILNHYSRVKKKIYQKVKTAVYVRYRYIIQNIFVILLFYYDFFYSFLFSKFNRNY